jgi:hypothetical protein
MTHVLLEPALGSGEIVEPVTPVAGPRPEERFFPDLPTAAAVLNTAGPGPWLPGFLPFLFPGLVRRFLCAP